MSLLSLDIRILLEFLQDPENNDIQLDVSSQLASLETLSSMCSDTDAVNCLRSFNGIKLIWNLCCSTNSLDVTHASLFALASMAQSNVFAQQDLCQSHVFSSLTYLLDSKETSLKTKTLIAYFFLSIVSKNKQGQNLISSSGCLDSLLSMFVQNSENLNDLQVTLEKLEFFKFLMKTLTYSVTVPQNAENQDKLIKVMPWIVNGIHSSQTNKEITCLYCELLTVVIEDNECGVEQALQSRVIEALILLINSLLPNNDDHCLGSAVGALNHVICNAEAEQSHKFLSFGGCKLLQKLMAKNLSKQWVVHHVNQTLLLYLKCFENHPKKFGALYLQAASHSLINLMKVIPDDDCFHKMSVQFLSLVMEATTVQAKPSPKKTVSNSVKPILALPTMSSTKKTDEFWENDPIVTNASKEDIFSNLVNNSDDLSCLKRQAFTTILLNTNADGHEELILDISKSSISALRSSSGVTASPSDDVYPHPPGNWYAEDKKSYTRFKKPLLRHRMSGTRSKISNRLNNSVCPRVKPSCVRYSTPKSKKFTDRPRLCCERRKSSQENDDVLSVCSELIDHEVLNSVRMQHGLKNFGNSGLLSRKLHV